MKAVLLTCLLAFLAISCAHKKDEKPKYSPEVSFQEGGETYSAQVMLPKDFKEKVPLVVVVHEWWGRTPYIEARARMLNQEGFAALPVDLFGSGKTVETPREAQALATPFYQNPNMGVERLKKFVDKVKQDPHVDPNQVYVIGYCFGGTQALNLAKSGADVAGVVSFHGTLTDYPIVSNPKANFLILNGAADPMVPAKDVKALENQLKEAKANYKIVNYPGAKHAFTNPKATERGKKFKIPIAYHQKADKASWEELLKFLKK